MTFADGVNPQPVTATRVLGGPLVFGLKVIFGITVNRAEALFTGSLTVTGYVPFGM